MWLAAPVNRRIVVIVLAVAVLVLGGLLVLTKRGAVVIEQTIGPTSCAYDNRLKSVVMTVPILVKTRGEVSWRIQAQVHDRRHPSRMPYVTTRVVTIDSGGTAKRQDLSLQVSMQRSEWLAGHNDCGIRVSTADLP